MSSSSVLVTKMGKLAKIGTVISLSKISFLGSTDIRFYDTGENKAVRILAAGDSAGDLNMSTVASVTCFGVTSKASLCNI